MTHTRVTYHRTWETGLRVAIRVTAFSPDFFERSVLLPPLIGDSRNTLFLDFVSSPTASVRPFSFAPLGLVLVPLQPTAYAVGCILTPLRGCRQSHATSGTSFTIQSLSPKN